MCSSTPWLVCVNLLSLIISMVVLIIGAIIQTSLNGHHNLFSGYINAPAALAISFGSLISLTSLLAIISVYCRNRILLCVYICILAALVVIEVSMGAAYFIAKSYWLELITDSMRIAESKYSSDHFASSTWNTVQRDLKCCGVDNYEEWFHYLGNSSVPDSCCVLYTIDCGSRAVSKGNAFQTGCAAAIVQWAQRHAASIAILLSAIIILQLLSLILSQRIRVLLYHYDSVDSY